MLGFIFQHHGLHLGMENDPFIDDLPIRNDGVEWLC
jgi:hypothetical protein